jgi:hypothetical protein
LLDHTWNHTPTHCYKHKLFAVPFTIIILMTGELPSIDGAAYSDSEAISVYNPNSNPHPKVIPE